MKAAGYALHRAATRVLRPLGEPPACIARALRRHRGHGGHLVRRAVLRPLLSDSGAQARSAGRESLDCGRDRHRRAAPSWSSAALSDRIGRKKVRALGLPARRGHLLSGVPRITHFANPAIEEAAAAAPVTVIADATRLQLPVRSPSAASDSCGPATLPRPRSRRPACPTRTEPGGMGHVAAVRIGRAANAHPDRGIRGRAHGRGRVQGRRASASPAL